MELNEQEEKAQVLIDTVLSFSKKYLASPENRPQEPEVKSIDLTEILKALSSTTPEELEEFLSGTDGVYPQVNN